jgi:CubicO group peptidase (beta-lactamase class C family)
MTRFRPRIHPVGTALLLAIAVSAAAGAEPEKRAPGGAVPTPAAVARDAMIARAKALELPTPYVPPPGDPLEHDAAGYAKIMCSAVFITGLDPDFAAENVGYFTGPYASRAKVGRPVIDRARQAVHITLPNGVVRTAVYLGDQGCVTLPRGKTSVNFTPVVVRKRLPDPLTQAWPMGDVLPKDPLPAALDGAKIGRAVEAAFTSPAGLTAAFVATWKGRVIAERYGAGITLRTPLESWSMGKSLSAALLGILIKDGVYHLGQRAPIPEWQAPGDPRAEIRIADLLQMASGLRIRAPLDPDYDPMGPYPDHVYLYTGGVNSFHYAATRPLQWPPGKVGRYHNTEPVLVNYLVRLGVERRGEEYLSFPQRALFDKIGIRTMVIETDPDGNFLTQGYDYASGRDWARLGNLYLQDGVWNGERILPEGFVKFVRTLAPAWAADQRPIYGGFFWLNGDRRYPVPPDAYYMAGAGGQTTMIIPSHDLVVVRLGHYKGSTPGEQDLRQALTLLMDAVPRNR